MTGGDDDVSDLFEEFVGFRWLICEPVVERPLGRSAIGSSGQ